jgi:antitoxin PrlF
MSSKTYILSPAKIGNASGFRLPASFYRDHPQFTNATGWVEVLANDTLLIKLETVEPALEEEGDEVILSLFLDFITKDALKNSGGMHSAREALPLENREGFPKELGNRLEAYTEAMAQEDDELLAGVDLEA